jgi:hypothetical protein
MNRWPEQLNQCVEAIRVYFNRADLADQLQRARRRLREDRQVSVRANPNSAVPRRVVDRLGGMRFGR